MGSCLLQQLFRQKIGQDVDPNFFHDTGFIDILYRDAERRDKIKRDPTMKTLVHDLNMIRRVPYEISVQEKGCSGIISTDQVGYRTGTWNKGLLTKIRDRVGGRGVQMKPLSPEKIDRYFLKNSQSKSVLESLGLIDIVNILRSMRHPKIYHKSIGHRNWYYRQLSQDRPYGFRAPAPDRPPMRTPQYQGEDLIIIFEEVDEEEINKSITDGLHLDLDLFGEGREWGDMMMIDEIREEIRLSDLRDIQEFIERMIYKGEPLVWKVMRFFIGNIGTWCGSLRRSE